MEEAVDPQVAISTEAAEVSSRPADPRSPPKSKATVRSADRRKSVDERKIRQRQSHRKSLDSESQQQQQQQQGEEEEPHSPPPTEQQQLPHSAEAAALDEEKIHSTIDMSINPADVLSGRGKQSFNHVGNKYFREVIARSLEEYMQKQTRFEKSLVVQNIVDEIHGRGGRFLKQDSRTGRYTVELTMTQSREKVGHAIRDAANLYTSKQRPGPRPTRDFEDPFNVPVAAGVRPPPPPLRAAAAIRNPSAKRPRQQPQPHRGSLGSTSSSILSLVGGNNASPISGRENRTTTPNVLLYQSPIEYLYNIPQQQQQQQMPYFGDPLSPSASSASVYGFTSTVNPNNNDNNINIAEDTVVFPNQPPLQPTTIYQLDPQIYNQRQQLFQQQLLPQQQGGNDPLHASYPSQQIATYNIPIPQQQSTIPQRPESRSTQRQETAADQDTVLLQPQSWIPYRRLPYNIPEPLTGHPSNVSATSFDVYTQMLFQEQQDRFYRDYQATLNQPPIGQRLPGPHQNDDYFLDAIDSVLGPMDHENNNNPFDDGLSQQPLDRTAIATTVGIAAPRMQYLGHPEEQSDSPDVSLEEQKHTSSTHPTSSNPSDRTESSR